MGKYVSIVIAGLGAGAVSLLLLAGCRDSGGGEEEPSRSPTTVSTEAADTGTVSTETLNTAGPASITIPGVKPPARSSVRTTGGGGCGIEGLTCTTTTESPSDDESPPEPTETAEPTG